jgi:anaerobic selenocysteine-containing dehydrogenase
VTVTISHPMLFEVYVPVDKDRNETYSSNAVTHSYKNMISDIIMSHGQVLIWQERDDERYMHALRFEKEDLKKNRTVYSLCLSCSGGCSVEANTTSMYQMMGIQW